MIRDGTRFLGRVACSLGLLLAAQLAYAAGNCAFALEMEAQGVVLEQRCLNTGTTPDACMANPQRVNAAAAAPVPSSPDSPSSADAPRYGRGISLAAVEPRLPAGLAPGSPSPLYILFRRYLS